MDNKTHLDLFVSVGEKSGDMLAASLLSPLVSQIQAGGIVGDELQKLGITPLFSIDSFGIMGFFDVIRFLPRLISLFRKVKKTILDLNPHSVLLVDNAEFHLLLAKSLRKNGYKGKIIQLVAPSIWAWRPHRKKILEDNVDLLFSLYPFEKKFFHHSKLKVVSFPHPVLSRIQNHPFSPIEELEGKPTIALFPGSRKKEITLNLKLQLEALSTIHGYEIAIALSSKKFLPLVTSLIKNYPHKVHIIDESRRFDLMKECHLAISKLGTVNLELACMGTPTVCTFPLPFIERFLLQHAFKVFLPHYSLVNLLLQRRLFPEYVAIFARAKLVYLEVQNLLDDHSHRELIREGTQELKKKLTVEMPSPLYLKKILF